jgi:hypothetical protein
LLWQVLPPVQSELPQHPLLAIHTVPQSFGAEVGHPHWFVWQVLPPEQSELPQHPELATQTLPQSLGVDVGHPHWLPWQVLLPPHCELAVHWTHWPFEQNGVVPPQSLAVQHAVVAMQESVDAQYFCPPRHLPAQAAVWAMQAPSQS